MEQNIKTAKFLAKLLDSQFQIAGVRFGIDPIISIIPWFGTAAGALLSVYILNVARGLGVSKMDFILMVTNVAADFLIGLVPILGVIFDVTYKANLRNIKILEKYSNKFHTTDKIVEGTVIK